MSISQKDIKLLWGRAAGSCSAPGCKENLTAILENSGAVTVGDMAHVIGRRPGSARSSAPMGADDTYNNLILLCPNHHRLIDQAAADFPEELLHEWKQSWEDEVDGVRVSIPNRSTLFREILDRLIENSQVFNEWGPESERATLTPESEQAAAIWHLRRIGVVIPNNRSMVQFLRRGKAFLSPKEWVISNKFIDHAEFYETHCGSPQHAAAYLSFPVEFEEMIRRETQDG